MKKLNLPTGVENCINTITSHGFEAFAVGGCVRDSLLGRNPKDYDVATNAAPDDIIGMFPKTVPTGIAFGTVTVMMDSLPIEVTTYRSDGEYGDFRRPTTVSFGSKIEDDLSRRDFTVNAMAYNHESGLVDLFGGQSDLQNGVIRCVGKPADRFSEDALRIMRCFRFALRLGFDIEQETLSAALEMSGNLEKISVERIAVELTGCLAAKCPARLKTLLDTGCLSFLGMNGGSDLSRLDRIMNDRCARLAALLLLTKTENAFLKNLRLDNRTINTVSVLTMNSSVKPPVTAPDICRLLGALPYELSEQYYSLREALYDDDTKISRNMLRYVVDNDLPYKISHLKINGNEIIRSGAAKEGREVGIILNRLLQAVIDDPSLNERQKLLSLAVELFQQ